MSKKKSGDNPLKEFNILDTSFGDGLQIEFTEDGFKPDPIKKDAEEPEGKKNESTDPEKKEPKETEEVILKKEDQEPVKKDSKVEPEKQVSDEDISPLKTFASWLGEKGIVDFEEEKFEDSEEGLEKLVVSSIDKGIQNYKNSLPEEFHTLLEFVEAGGNPKDFMDVYYNQRSWEEYSLEDDKSQKFVLEEFLKAQAADDKGNVSAEDLEDIKETLDTYEVSGVLEKKAKLALTKLQSWEKGHKAQLVEAQKKYDIEQKALVKKQVDEFKDALYKKEEIQGFKLTPKMKDNLWDFIMKPDKQGKTGLQKHNETNQDAQFMYAYLAMNDWNLEKLERQVKTKINSELASKLGNFKDSRSKIKSGQTESFSDKKASGFSAFRQALDNGAL